MKNYCQQIADRLNFHPKTLLEDGEVKQEMQDNLSETYPYVIKCADNDGCIWEQDIDYSDGMKKGNIRVILNLELQLAAMRASLQTQEGLNRMKAAASLDGGIYK